MRDSRFDPGEKQEEKQWKPILKLSRVGLGERFEVRSRKEARRKAIEADIKVLSGRVEYLSECYA